MSPLRSSPLRSIDSATPSPTSSLGSITSVSTRCSVRCSAIDKPRVADAEPHLAEPRATAHAHREGARRDFEIERPAVARGQRVEAAGLVADDAGEHVEPPGRTLGIGAGAHGRAADRGFRAAARDRRSRAPAPRHRSDRADAVRASGCVPRPCAPVPAGSSSGRDRRRRRAADRGWPAAPDRRRTRGATMPPACPQPLDVARRKYAWGPELVVCTEEISELA